MKQDHKLFFEVVTGEKVPFEPVSTMMLGYIEQGIRAEYVRQGRPIDVPIYTVETAGGGEQAFEMDAEYVEANPDQKELWENHLKAVNDLDAEINEARQNVLMDAVLVDLPEDETWLKRQKKYRVLLPTKPKQDDFENDEEYQEAHEDYLARLRRHYLETEVLKTVEDLYGLIEEIMMTSLKGSMSEEELEAARQSFRNSLQGVKRELETIEQPDSEAGKVDS